MEVDIAEKERKMTIAVGLVPPKELGFHLNQCIGASLIANYFVMMLSFRANKRADADGAQAFSATRVWMSCLAR